MVIVVLLSFIKIIIISLVTFIPWAFKIGSGDMSCGTGFALLRDTFSRFDSISVGVSGHSTITNPVLPHITAVTQKCFLAQVNNFFTRWKRSHFLLTYFSVFLCSSNEQMTKTSWVGPLIGNHLLKEDWNTGHLIG